MELENSLDAIIEDEAPVVMRNLVITTKDNALKYIKDNYYALSLNELYFVSGTFPQEFKVNVRGQKKQWVGCKQYIQYIWIRQKFVDLFELLPEIKKMCIIFEQTKKGDIHYHILAHTTLHKHDLRAIIAELFDFVKATDIIINVFVSNVTNLDDLTKYMFDKTTKTYESLDMTIFKPLILI